ncbi:unnamed protein product [Scytosiphon promiscuus]
MALTIDLEAGLRPPPPPERGTPDGRLVFKKLLGQGAEGLVYLAVPARRCSRQQQQIPHQALQTSACPSSGGRRPHSAVKVVSGGRAYERCRASRGLWPKLVHPNIVFPRESWWDDANRRCFVQMELCRTDLLDLVCDTGALGEERGSVFAGHLASALAHLHGQGIAHQDVKLENIFVSADGIAKLGDTGSVVQILPHTVRRDDDGNDGGSKQDSCAAAATAAIGSSSSAERDDSAERFSAEPYTSSSSSFVGSVMYAPPEMVSGSHSNSGGGGRGGGEPTRSLPVQERRGDRFAADMWALGVSIWSALAGCHPWELACVHRSNEFRTFVRQGAAATLPMSFSPGLRSLLASLLSLDPRHRPTAAEVLASRWVSPPPTTPPPSSLSSSACGATIPSWRSAFEPSARTGEVSLDGQQQQPEQEQQQQQQQPAPVTPSGASEDILPLPVLHPEVAGTDADPTAAAGGAISAPAATAAAVDAAATPTAVLQPSPIRSRHRRSKKRKVPEEEAGGEERRGAGGATVLQGGESGCGFVLTHHTKRGRENHQPRQQAGDGDVFSTEMDVLGSILNGTNGGREFGGGGGAGDGGDDASGTGGQGRGGGRGERPTKIARVSPSPLTLPAVMMAADQQQQQQRPEELNGNIDDNHNGMALSAFFSGLGTQQGLLGFLKAPSPPPLPPAPTEMVVRHRIAAAGGQGRRRRGRPAASGATWRGWR